VRHREETNRANGENTGLFVTQKLSNPDAIITFGPVILFAFHVATTLTGELEIH